MIFANRINSFSHDVTQSCQMLLCSEMHDFDFDIVNFPFLDGDVPRRTSYGVYISQLIRFARATSNVSDFNCRNKALTANSLSRAIIIISYVSKVRLGSPKTIHFSPKYCLRGTLFSYI